VWFCWAAVAGNALSLVLLAISLRHDMPLIGRGTWVELIVAAVVFVLILTLAIVRTRDRQAQG
jgi:hypothetical protein